MNTKMLSFLFLLTFFFCFPILAARDPFLLEKEILAKDRDYQEQLIQLNRDKTKVARFRGEIREKEVVVKTREKYKENALKKLRNVQRLVVEQPEISTEKERKAYAQSLEALKKANQALEQKKQQLAQAEKEEASAQSALEGIQREKENLKQELVESHLSQLTEEITQTHTVIVSAEAGCGGSESVGQCRRRALELAKNNAIQRGSATFYDSITEIRNFRLSREEVRSRVKGIVLKYRVLDKGWVSETSYYYKIRAEVKGQIPPDFRKMLMEGLKITQPPAQKQSSPNLRIEPTTQMAFVLVKGGCYSMGDHYKEGDSNEKPVHEVCVDDFYLGQYEVTQKQWQKVMGENPAWFKNRRFPVDSVSWKRTQLFIQKLKDKSNVSLRLPTEAEWEYACREGGKKVRFGNGKDIANPDEINFDGNRKSRYSVVGQYRGKSTLAGNFSPNALELYDMSGNLWEWTADLYQENSYKKHRKNNPLNDQSGSHRVLRGGSWGDFPGQVRCTFRNFGASSIGSNDAGFRLLWPVK